jgi:hypothetical protein
MSNSRISSARWRRCRLRSGPAEGSSTSIFSSIRGSARARGRRGRSRWVRPEPGGGSRKVGFQQPAQFAIFQRPDRSGGLGSSPPQRPRPISPGARILLLRNSRGGNRFAPDSPLEESGFELSVPSRQGSIRTGMAAPLLRSGVRCWNGHGNLQGERGSGAGWARAGVPAEAASIRRIMSGRCSRLLAAIGPECGDRSCIALAAVLGRGYRHFCGTTKFM